MLDGFRRLAIVFAVISLLTPSVNLMAGTISKGKSRKAIAEHSSSNCGSAAHGNNAKAGITQQARAEAADIFESRCVACHGTEGRGDGPASANLNPRPRDFHNLKWQKSIDDASLARAIVYGGRSAGVSAEMAPNPDLENEPAVVAALVERVRGWCK
jgi:mono/diheme cytochrome c family protein